MSDDPSSLPRLAATLTRPLPVFPVSLGFTRVMRTVMARHPELLRRMGDHAGRRFWLEVTDMPWSLLLEPSAQRITAVHRYRPAPDHDVHIAGRLTAFLDMLHGVEDGDALFFSRDLTVEGDTAAALAMRNAVDDAELDLADELSQAAGRLAPHLARLIGAVEPLTGLRLRRAAAGEPATPAPARTYVPYAKPAQGAPR